MSDTNALATRAKEISLAPDYLKEMFPQADHASRAAGLEAYRSDKDIMIPRFKLLQALSPEVQEGLGKPGDILHGVTNDVLATTPQGGQTSDPIRIVVVKHFLQWIEWKPRDQGGGVIATSTDVNGELAKRCEQGDKVMDNGREVAAVTEYHNFICLVPSLGLGLEGVIMACCGKTNWKHGRNLITRMVMRGPQYPAYAGAYVMQSAAEKNKQGQAYKVFKFSNDGWASKEEILAAKDLFEGLKGKDVTTNLDEKEGDAALGSLDEKEM